MRLKYEEALNEYNKSPSYIFMKQKSNFWKEHKKII